MTAWESQDGRRAWNPGSRDGTACLQGPWACGRLQQEAPGKPRLGPLPGVPATLSDNTGVAAGLGEAVSETPTLLLCKSFPHLVCGVGGELTGEESGNTTLGATGGEAGGESV